MKKLWELAARNERVGIEDLGEPLRACVMEGDDVADHYGGRTRFTFAEQRADRLLVLEHNDDGTVTASVAINLTGGYGTGILGSEVAALRDSAAEQISQAPTANDEFHSPERYRLVKTLKRMVAEHTATDPAQWDITFTSTGTEAMDFALQLVHLDGYDLASGRSTRSEKDVVVACYGAWHGWGTGSSQLLDRRQFTDGLPRLKGFETVFTIYNNVDSLREVFALYRGRIRAVMVEGILGDGGVIPGERAWWNALFALAGDEGARIVDDEILSGFRTGSLLAIPPGLKPDCLTLGKGLGLGLFPLSAVAWRKASLSARPGVGVRTFNARPYQAALVNAAFSKIEHEHLFERAKNLGASLLDGLGRIATLYPGIIKAVRGRGLFIGLELADGYARSGREMRDRLLRHGVLTEVESGLFNRRVPKGFRVNETLRLTPPLTISQENLVRAVQQIEQCCATMLGQRAAT